MDGVLSLDKPAGITSARAVGRVKRLLPRRTKVGHAGTLDPFATGVLVLLVGRATHLAEWFMAQPKQYLATVKLGATTPTLDPDSPEQPLPGAAPPALETMQAALSRMIGRVEQRPPAYSALKVAGRRAYDLARRGQSPPLEARIVEIYGIDLLQYSWPLLRLRIDCGRGTYIRAIARDLGEALATGGYLTALQRTRVGPCLIEHCVELARLETEGIGPFLRPMDEFR